MRACPFCAEQIQDAAIVCKHCRRDLLGPTPAAPPTAGAGAGAQSPWAALVTIAVFAYVGWVFFGSATSSTPNSGARVSANPPFYGEVSANALFDAYKQNEVAADQSFKGRRVSLRATIERIGKDFLDNPYVILRVPGESIGGLHAEFDTAATVARFYAGQSIEVKCTVDGKIVWDVILRHCSQ